MNAASTAAPVTDPLAPITRHAALDGRPGPTCRACNGIAPGLIVHDRDGWMPATVPDQRRRRWTTCSTRPSSAGGPRPHAAAALAWKCYSYWVALPAVLGYATARRVPLMRPDGVVARWSPHQPFVTVGLTSVEVAVLPSDPLAAPSRTARRAMGIVVVPDDEALCWRRCGPR